MAKSNIGASYQAQIYRDSLAVEKVVK